MSSGRPTIAHLRRWTISGWRTHARSTSPQKPSQSISGHPRQVLLRRHIKASGMCRHQCLPKIHPWRSFGLPTRARTRRRTDTSRSRATHDSRRLHTRHRPGCNRARGSSGMWSPQHRSTSPIASSRGNTDAPIRPRRPSSGWRANPSGRAHVGRGSTSPSEIARTSATTTLRPSHLEDGGSATSRPVRSISPHSGG